MRLVSIPLLVLAIAASAVAQQSADGMATANGKTFTAADLSADTQKLYANQAQVVADARTQLLNKMISDHLIELEAKAKGITPEKLVVDERAKAVGPTEEQINAVYEANKQALSSRPPAEARKQVVEFLRRDPEEAALKKYIESLAAKYKPVMAKDINAADLKSLDTIFTVGTRSFNDREFEDKYKLVLYDVRADILDQAKDEIENVVYVSLIAAEANSLGTDPGEVIAKEITNKMKDFSDEERVELEAALRKRLFTKYNAKFLINYPPPIVQAINVDGAPSRGDAAAPVTVVMFSDFQCPACSGTHPILQKVLAKYGDKIRFVVRDFPLTTIHDHSYRAALAGYAAQQQGKFFDYIEILYKNQSALDDASLIKYAAGVGLNVKRFELDLSSENAAAYVKKDMADGNAYGISSTPTIFVNGVKVRRLSADGFHEAIDAALNTK
jgi:protein-disulfide isomerase